MHLRDFQQLVPEDWLRPDIFSNSHGVVGHILQASLEISVKHDLHLSLPSGSIAKIRLFFCGCSTITAKLILQSLL